MENCFCFLRDEYYKKFPDENLMHNRNGGLCPFFFAFEDANTGLLWLVPVSSKVDKYKARYDKQMAKRGRDDQLAFEELLGRKAVFLIQNICPSSHKYIDKTYTLKNGEIVAIPESLAEEIRSKAKRLISLLRRGHSFIYPDVLAIEKALLEDHSRQH